MNTRNVMVLIFGTVLLSVSSALIAVRLTQDKTITEANSSAPVAAKAVSVAAAPTAPTALAGHENSAAAATGTNTATRPAPETALPPQVFIQPDVNAYLDNRKPLSVDEVQNTLLKATPDCKEDYQKLCLGNSYLAEHPLACLRNQKDHLSRACFNQVAAVRDQFQKDCASDIRRLCPKQSSYFGCLKQQVDSLSPACRNNIQQFSRR
ncbi:hypothetical protein EZJ49_07150 [Bdellovibrio bacteriovorus]|uniref:hypothetical protein n=1 Tax=Bdellovibrio bacteriovorus TaxID=959 RepID=UPI0021D18F15|nr:hypothetical protein [Bdellovibrio bacteriovorus]UXR66023.1 hypothetical protein EZJ49_07150 [Bdellovibrio bacteriovorus]